MTRKVGRETAWKNFKENTFARIMNTHKYLYAYIRIVK